MKKFTVEEIIEKLTNFKFTDPELVSDGYGEFPNGYKFTKQNLNNIEKLFN